MVEFYYDREGEESAYRIDEVLQRVLVYLSAHGQSPLTELVETAGPVSESELRERITEYLGIEAAGLVTQSESAQETLGDGELVVYYELTKDGEQFVAENKSLLAMPADFAEIADTIGELRMELVETRDTMHRLDAEELSERLSDLAQKLESLQYHISNFD